VFVNKLKGGGKVEKGNWLEVIEPVVVRTYTLVYMRDRIKITVVYDKVVEKLRVLTGRA